MKTKTERQVLFSQKEIFESRLRIITSFILVVSLICGVCPPLFTSEAEAATISRQYGDVYWDGNIDSRDTDLVLQHISASVVEANKKKHPDWILKGDDYKVADVNCDGVIDSRDTLRLMDYVAAATVPSIREKHPDWISYLNRSYRYNANVQLTTNRVNLDLNGNNTCKLTVAHNYNRRPCRIVLKKNGVLFSSLECSGWGSAYSLKVTGNRVGRFYFTAEIYDTRKNALVATSNALTINVTSGSKSIPTNKKITVFRQNIDKYKVNYGTNEHGKRMTLYKSGCGVFAIVNAVYYLKNTKIDPMKLAQFALSTNDIEKRDGKLYKLRYPGGNSDNLAKVFCNKKGGTYGIKFIKSVGSLSEAKAYLKNGNVAVAHVSGHFIALVNYNKKDGKYLILDSYPSGNRGTLSKEHPGYRWMTEKQFAGKMALVRTSYNHNLPIHIIGCR